MSPNLHPSTRIPLIFAAGVIAATTVVWLWRGSERFTRYKARLAWTFARRRANIGISHSSQGWRTLEYHEWTQPWLLLEHFFTAAGYHYFPDCHSPIEDEILPLKMFSIEEAVDVYPYARRLYLFKQFFMADMPAPQVYPAIDLEGRDVVLKFVDERELAILRVLNSPGLRKDPRNHSLPVIEFLEFGKYNFAVFPRWVVPNNIDFEDVAQVLNFADIMLEGLAFLHEHRIAHYDIKTDNIVVNVIPDPCVQYPEGLQNPGDVRYAFIDFGQSHFYPEGTELQSVDSLPMFIPVRGRLENMGRMANPFAADVINLGEMLGRVVRVAQDVVPGLGDFFESITQTNVDSNPPAHEALASFRLITSRVTKSQLEIKLLNRFWTYNGMKSKAALPFEPRPPMFRA